jgi:predicted ester cyclase
MNLHELVDRQFDNYNAHDVDAIIAVYHPAGIIRSPMYPSGAGIDEHREALRSVFGAFDDARFDAELLVVERQRVSVEFRVAGTHTGPLRIPGIRSFEATRHPFSIRGMLVQEFDATSKVLAERAYWDTTTLLTQLGLELGAETAPVPSGS